MANEQTTNEQVETPDVDAVVNPEDANVEIEQNAADVDQSTQNVDPQLAAALAEIATLKDQALRAAAEAQNARRRAEQDVEKAHKFGLEKFANEMLPIVDSLERALEACNPEDEATKALRDGVEMTYNMFVSGLAKFNVEIVNPQGEVFDPQMHQAMSMIDVPDTAANTVVAVMQKGFSLNGRLIRPAMVVVAKG
jgi:molecular chaperone GrpE